MTGSCCDFRDAAGRQFTAERLRKNCEGSLLDIGGGVGALTFELPGGAE